MRLQPARAEKPGNAETRAERERQESHAVGPVPVPVRASARSVLRGLGPVVQPVEVQGPSPHHVVVREEHARDGREERGVADEPHPHEPARVAEKPPRADRRSHERHEPRGGLERHLS